MIHCNRSGMSIGPMRVLVRRVWGDTKAPWLVQLCVDIDARLEPDHRNQWPTSAPQCRATVDDFGNLILVTGWH